MSSPEVKLNWGKAILYVILAAVFSAIIALFVPYAFIPGTILATAVLYFTSPPRNASTGQAMTQRPMVSPTYQPAPTSHGRMYCVSCGAPLKPGSKFCTSCGARMG